MRGGSKALDIWAPTAGAYEKSKSPKFPECSRNVVGMWSDYVLMGVCMYNAKSKLWTRTLLTTVA